MLQKAVARRIREIMRERNLTQYQLFKLSGVAQSTISTLLNSHNNTVKVETIYQLCCGLQMDLEEFFNVDYLRYNNLEG